MPLVVRTVVAITALRNQSAYMPLDFEAREDKSCFQMSLRDRKDGWKIPGFTEKEKQKSYNEKHSSRKII